MIRRMLVSVALGAAACTDGTGLGGDDIGQTLDRGDPVSLAPEGNGDLPTGTNGTFDGECHPLEEALPDVLMTATGGENLIEVVHFGIAAGDPADFTVDGTVSGDGEITMEYEAANAEPATCNWKLSYTIYGVSAGTWTVHANGDSATATVTGESW